MNFHDFHTPDVIHIYFQFAFTGLNKEQCARMINEHHVYLTGDGRVSMAGVTLDNAPYIAESIHEVTK